MHLKAQLWPRLEKPLASDEVRQILTPSVAQILRAQDADGAIYWYEDGVQLDVWNMLEAAMGLASWGEVDAAQRALDWAAENQCGSGGWAQEYCLGEVYSPVQQMHHAAYIATAALHLQRCGAAVGQYGDAVVRALDFVLQQQSDQGEIYWAVDEDGEVHRDALLTAGSSVYISLSDALQLAPMLGVKPALVSRWSDARDRLGEALRHRPELFDRTWDSKSGYAMDWFYPVLAGLGTPSWAEQRIDARWLEFVHPQLGCRCVADQPWVTVAESCELAMTLARMGRRDDALNLYADVLKMRDVRGRLWTGYQYEMKVWWPHEQPSWSSGAALLAADALYGWSDAGALWLQR